MGPDITEGYSCLPMKTEGGEAPNTEVVPLFTVTHDSMERNFSSMGHAGRPQKPLPLHSTH